MRETVTCSADTGACSFEVMVLERTASQDTAGSARLFSSANRVLRRVGEGDLVLYIDEEVEPERERVVSGVEWKTTQKQ